MFGTLNKSKMILLFLLHLMLTPYRILYVIIRIGSRSFSQHKIFAIPFIGLAN